MKDWKKLKAGDVMSSPLVSMVLGTPLGEAADVLTENEFSGAPIVDATGEVVGVVSLFDIANFVSGMFHGSENGWYRYGTPPLKEDVSDSWEGDRDPLRDNRVEDVMSSKIVSVDEETPMPKVVHTMESRHIHRVFVTRDGKPVGILTTMDVLRSLKGVPCAS